MKMQEIRDDWWIPIDDDAEWIRSQTFDYERELFELREWWCRPRQISRQLELPLVELPQPKKVYPF